MAFENLEEAKARLKEVAQGGVFTDENLQHSLDWSGESATGEEKAEETTVLDAKTERQQEDEQLQIEKVSPAVMAIIVKRVEQQLLHQEGGVDSSVMGVMERRLKAEADKIQKWLKAEEARKEKQSNTDLTAEIESLKKTIAKQAEELSILQGKYDKFVVTTTMNGPREVAVLHECEQMLKARRAIDDSEMGSMPSVVPRIQEQSQLLTERLRCMEAEIPATIDRTVAAAGPARSARRRFGQRF